MLYKYLTEQVMCFHDINISRPAIAEFCIDMENLRTFQVSTLKMSLQFTSHYW